MLLWPTSVHIASEQSIKTLLRVCEVTKRTRKYCTTNTAWQKSACLACVHTQFKVTLCLFHMLTNGAHSPIFFFVVVEGHAELVCLGVSSGFSGFHQWSKDVLNGICKLSKVVIGVYDADGLGLSPLWNFFYCFFLDNPFEILNIIFSKIHLHVDPLTPTLKKLLLCTSVWQFII